MAKEADRDLAKIRACGRRDAWVRQAEAAQARAQAQEHAQDHAAQAKQQSSAVLSRFKSVIAEAEGAATDHQSAAVRSTG